jgi:hypothetical protein
MKTINYAVALATLFLTLLNLSTACLTMEGYVTGGYGWVAVYDNGKEICWRQDNFDDKGPWYLHCHDPKDVVYLLWGPVLWRYIAPHADTGEIGFSL